MSQVHWKIREEATGLNHHVVSTLPFSAVLLCGDSLRVDWSRWTEMPSSTTITCIGCMSTWTRSRWW